MNNSDEEKPQPKKKLTWGEAGLKWGTFGDAMGKITWGGEPIEEKPADEESKE